MMFSAVIPCLEMQEAQSPQLSMAVKGPQSVGKGLASAVCGASTLSTLV